MKNSNNKSKQHDRGKDAARHVSTLLALVVFATISCSRLYDNVEKYADSETVYADKLDGIIRVQIGYERAEIDLMEAGRIPASQIITGKAKKTIIECEDFTEPGNRRVYDSVCSWVNVTGLTQLKNYDLSVYTEDEFGNRSIPLTTSVRPYTLENLNTLELVLPTIIETTSAVLVEWKEPISARTHTVYRYAYSYTDRTGVERTGAAKGDVPSFIVENVEKGAEIPVSLSCWAIPTLSNYDGTYTPILDTVNWVTTVRLRISENAEPAIFLKTPAPAFEIITKNIDDFFPINFSWVTVPEADGYSLKISTIATFPEGASTYTVNVGDVGDYLMNFAEGSALVNTVFPGWTRLYWTVMPTSPSVPIKNQVRHLSINRSIEAKIGLWQFDDPDDITKATIGKPLQIVTVIGTPQIFSIDGPSASNKAIRITNSYNSNVSYFLADHGLRGMGGDDYVSEYTLFFEFRVNSWRRPNGGTYNCYHPLFKTRIDAPAVDCEVFVAKRANIPDPAGAGDIGTGATGYAAEVVQLGQWYRLYLTYNTNVQQYYLNGARIINSTSSDGRHRLNGNGVFFFATNHGDINFENFDVAEIGMWNRQLSAEEIAELESGR